MANSWIDATTASGGMGLQNMGDRVGALDGRLSITRAGSDGTIVSGVIPLRGEREPDRLAHWRLKIHRARTTPAGTCEHHRATRARLIACRPGAEEDPGGREP